MPTGNHRDSKYRSDNKSDLTTIINEKRKDLLYRSGFTISKGCTRPIYKINLPINVFTLKFFRLKVEGMMEEGGGFLFENETSLGTCVDSFEKIVRSMAY